MMFSIQQTLWYSTASWSFLRPIRRFVLRPVSLCLIVAGITGPLRRSWISVLYNSQLYAALRVRFTEKAQDKRSQVRIQCLVRRWLFKGTSYRTTNSLPWNHFDWVRKLRQNIALKSEPCPNRTPPTCARAQELRPWAFKLMSQLHRHPGQLHELCAAAKART